MGTLLGGRVRSQPNTPRARAELFIDVSLAGAAGQMYQTKRLPCPRRY